jgi:hypothetical protein
MYAVRTEAAFGALNVHTLLHTEAGYLAADLISVFVAWAFFLVFAFSDWPALRALKSGPGAAQAQPIAATPSSRLHGHGARGHVSPPMAVRPLPNVEGKPAGWFPSGAMGAGEQSYWNGEAWTARRQWRNEMWIDLPAPVLEGAAPA